MFVRLLAQAALVAAISAASSYADEWDKTYTVSGKPELRVETDDASVTVRAWDQKSIAARVTTTRWKIGSGEVEVWERQAGDRVEITVRCPHRNFAFSLGNRSIHVEIQVPRRVQADIHTGDGSIHASGLEGETRLRTGDGGIEADSLDGSLDAESGDGHLRVRGRLDVLKLHTGDGSIEADVLPGSKMTSSWRVESGDGSVTIRLPADFATELDAHTGDGSIHIDFPITLPGGRRDHDLRATLNGGGAPFAIRTGDGSIHVGRL